jgi:hypothetical protein
MLGHLIAFPSIADEHWTPAPRHVSWFGHLLRILFGRH